MAGKEKIRKQTENNPPEMYADYITTVRYGETDAMRVAYYANYPVWFEAGRSEFGREFGLSYKEFEESGFYAVVAESYCRYIQPARFADKIIVRTWIAEGSSRTMQFKYNILRAEDMVLLATGYTKHVCISKEGRVAQLPPNWLQYVKSMKDKKSNPS